MVNPSHKWDRVPVYGVFLELNDSPVGGTIQFVMSARITTTDGRAIYPGESLAGCGGSEQLEVRPGMRYRILQVEPRVLLGSLATALL